MNLVLPNTNAFAATVVTGIRSSHVRALALLCLAWAGLATAGCQGSGNTMPGADMGTADGFPGLADCPGIPLTHDGNLDVNLRSVSVSGAVTLNGAPLPDAASSRGSIVLTDKRTRTSAIYDLGSTGAGHYALILAPGQYDVQFIGNTALCKSATNPVPCNAGVLKSGFQLSSSAVLDLDLRASSMQGKVTVDGAAVPAAYQHTGAIRFKSQSGGLLGTDVSGSDTGLANYRLVLLNGTYDVELLAPASCTAANPVPCSGGPLQRAVSLTTDGVLDLDVPSVQVTGTVRVNGQPVVSTDFKYGALTFQLSGGATTYTDLTSVGNGLAPYQLKLLRGTYNVGYEPRNNDCTVSVPCISGALKTAVALQTSGVLDLDIPLITVQGSVTINGQPVVSANETGTLEFRNADNGAVLTATTGPRKLGTYKVTLLPGTYQVSYVSQGSACNTPLAQAPCVGGPLKKGVALQASGVLDVDIPSIGVNGHITVNGSAVASADVSRGRLQFQLIGGGSTNTADLNPYTLRLVPGSYQVSYNFTAGSCQANDALPCGSGVLKASQSLLMAGNLDVDIPLVRTEGNVTLDGMPMPTIAATRGQLQFILGGSAFTTPNFGSSGAVTYRMALIPGTYEIAHQSDFNMCSANTGSLPCVGQVVAGCM